jgi:hypothetical protein
LQIKCHSQNNFQAIIDILKAHVAAGSYEIDLRDPASIETIGKIMTLIAADADNAQKASASAATAKKEAGGAVSINVSDYHIVNIRTLARSLKAGANTSGITIKVVNTPHTVDEAVGSLSLEEKTLKGQAG